MKAKTKKVREGSLAIIPLRDHRILSPPEYDIQLREGEEIEIPEIFKQNLITEKVIKGK